MNTKDSKFPELIETAVQATKLPSGSPLPSSLQAAIAPFLELILGAIAYLQHRHPRSIGNPTNYLYQAIMPSWNLSVVSSLLYQLALMLGLTVLSREVGYLQQVYIDVVHHTLHVQQVLLCLSLLACFIGFTE